MKTARLLSLLAATLTLLTVLFIDVPWARSQPQPDKVAVNIDKAALYWTWDGTTDFPTEFRCKCGNSPGNYTKITVIADPAARQCPVKTAIGSSGDWFCVVTAANLYGESGPTNEVFFSAGSPPINPKNAGIKTQQ